MAVKPMVRLDRVLNGHVDSFSYTSNLNQGEVVSLNPLVNDEVYEAVAPDFAKPIVFHCSVPMNYKDGLMEEDFVLEKKAVGRGYVLSVGDIVTITNNGVSGTPSAGKVLAAQAGNVQMKISNGIGDTANAPLVFRAEKADTLNGQPAFVYRVIKA